ncbi:MAG: hypothetical protein R3B06_29135 [Kofleriaceae bacterium]
MRTHGVSPARAGVSPLGGAVLALVAGCAGPAPATIADLRVTAPTGAAEVVPVADEALAIAWTATVTGAVDLTLALVPDQPSNPAVTLATVDAAAGQLRWLVPRPPPAPGTYRLTATATDAAGGAALATAAASAIVVVQGVVFRAAALTFTGADPERDVWLTVTNGQPIDVALELSPPGQAGPRVTVATATIASDLAPVGRVLRFDGTTVDGAPLAGGSYDAHLVVTPPARPTGYQVDGLTIHWTP